MQTTTNIPAELADYLAQKGVMARLAESRQAEREDERARMFDEIENIRRTEAEIMPGLIERQRQAQNDLDSAEASFQKARFALNEANRQIQEADASFRIQQRAGRLARLADPRIHQAIAQLHDFEGDVRRTGLATWTSREKAWDMAHNIITEHSNADDVNAVLAEIRAGAKSLDELLYVPRPEGIVEIVNAVLDSAESACARVGVKVQRTDVQLVGQPS